MNRCICKHYITHVSNRHVSNKRLYRRPRRLRGVRRHLHKFFALLPRPCLLLELCSVWKFLKLKVRVPFDEELCMDVCSGGGMYLGRPVRDYIQSHLDTTRFKRATQEHPRNAKSLLGSWHMVQDEIRKQMLQWH